LAILAATTLAVGGGQAFASTSPTLVVDDDGAQCANAESSIQRAVDKAAPGSVIRVCPGRYAESVTVDKPLTVKGDPDGVSAVDCFQPTVPELPADRYAIVDPADDTAVAFSLAANDVELSGLVIQGGSIGITTGDSSSGYRVHHNLIRSNRRFVAADGSARGGYSVEFGSSGPNASRIDHNCSRENVSLVGRRGWGIVSSHDVVAARIDHNSSYRLDGAIEVAGSARHSHLSIDHNTSMYDLTSIALWTSEDNSSIVANESGFSPTRAIIVGGKNVGLQITDNWVHDGWRGIVFTNRFFRAPGDPTGLAPVTDVLVRGNVIERGGLDGILVDSIFDAAGNVIGGNLYESAISANLISGNAGHGIVLRAGNSKNTINGNVSNANARNGIYAEGATGNAFAANSMNSNGTANPPNLPPIYFDARDDARAWNTWIGNQCLTDFPDGTICGLGLPAEEDDPAG
jgi:hypothetical protein